MKTKILPPTSLIEQLFHTFVSVYRQQTQKQISTSNLISNWILEDGTHQEMALLSKILTKKLKHIFKYLD